MSVARSNPAAVCNRGRYGFLAALFVLAAASTALAFAQQIPSGVLAAGNAVGGYVVTERMLKMFVLTGKKKGP